MLREIVYCRERRSILRQAGALPEPRRSRRVSSTSNSFALMPALRPTRPNLALMQIVKPVIAKPMLCQTQATSNATRSSNSSSPGEASRAAAAPELDTAPARQVANSILEAPQWCAEDCPFWCTLCQEPSSNPRDHVGKREHISLNIIYDALVTRERCWCPELLFASLARRGPGSLADAFPLPRPSIRACDLDDYKKGIIVPFSGRHNSSSGSMPDAKQDHHSSKAAEYPYYFTDRHKDWLDHYYYIQELESQRRLDEHLADETQGKPPYTDPFNSHYNQFNYLSFMLKFQEDDLQRRLSTHHLLNYCFDQGLLTVGKAFTNSSPFSQVDICFEGYIALTEMLQPIIMPLFPQSDAKEIGAFAQMVASNFNCESLFDLLGMKRFMPAAELTMQDTGVGVGALGVSSSSAVDGNGSGMGQVHGMQYPTAGDVADLSFTQKGSVVRGIFGQLRFYVKEDSLRELIEGRPGGGTPFQHMLLPHNLIVAQSLCHALLTELVVIKTTEYMSRLEPIWRQRGLEYCPCPVAGSGTPQDSPGEVAEGCSSDNKFTRSYRHYHQYYSSMNDSSLNRMYYGPNGPHNVSDYYSVNTREFGSPTPSPSEPAATDEEEPTEGGGRAQYRLYNHQYKKQVAQLFNKGHLPGWLVPPRRHCDIIFRHYYNNRLDHNNYSAMAARGDHRRIQRKPLTFLQRYR